MDQSEKHLKGMLFCCLSNNNYYNDTKSVRLESVSTLLKDGRKITSLM